MPSKLPTDMDDFDDSEDDQPDDDSKERHSDTGQDEAENTSLDLADGEAKPEPECFDSDHMNSLMLFPFLKDHGEDPATTFRYFKLTLGASMARHGDESHIKAFKKLFPEWYEPKSSSRSQPSNSPRPRSSSFRNASSRSSEVSPAPSCFTDQHWSPKRSPSVSMSPSPRYGDEMNTGTLKDADIINAPSPSPRSESGMNPIVENSYLEDPMSRLRSIHKKENSDKVRESFNKVPRPHIYYEKRADQNVLEKVSTKEQIPRAEPRVFQFPSVEAKIREDLNNSPFAGQPADVRRAGVASMILNSLKTHKSRDNKSPMKIKMASFGKNENQAPTTYYARSTSDSPSVQHHLSPRLGPRTMTSPCLRKYSSTLPPSVTPSPRDRRLSSSSQGGRRRSSSTLERLLGDVAEVPTVVGVDGLLQRRRRFSRRTSDQVTFIKIERTPSLIPSLERFRMVVRTVRIIAGVCLALKRYVQQKETTQWSFVEMYLHLEKDISPALAFDINSFSKKQPPKGGPRLKRLLCKPPEDRKPPDIQNILAYIRTHDTFQHFPVHVQIQLCACMQYQSYEARRIVLKEGHPASAFYLVLTGSLIVNILDSNPTTGQTFTRTLSQLHQGECFGEIALLERIPRTATIVCKTNVELLVIYREDFERLILTPLLQQRVGDVAFCVEHPLFEEFPTDVFYNNPKECFYQYFPKDTVVAKDSASCPYLVLVKTGLCQVVGNYKRGRHGDKSDVTRDLNRDMAQAFPEFTELLKIGLVKTTDSYFDRTEPETCISRSLEEGLLTGNMDKRVLRIADSSVPPNPWEPAKGILASSPRNRSLTLSNALDQMERDGRLYQLQLGMDGGNSAGQFWSERLRGPKEDRAQSAPSSRKHTQKGQFWRILQEDTLQFAEIASLTPGSVFGLETMVETPGPSVSLVSQGAECMMVSKKLFLKYATINTLRVAGDIVMTFPKPASLKQSVIDKRKWKQFKNDLIAMATSTRTHLNNNVYTQY